MATALFSDAYPIYPKPQCAAAARTALDVKRAGLADGPIRVKGVYVGLLVVLVSWELAASTHPNDLAARSDALAAGRTIGVKGTGESLRDGESEDNAGKQKPEAYSFHASPSDVDKGYMTSRILT